MLYLVGLGLWDEMDITLKGLEIAKSADKVYIEGYTSWPMGLDISSLKKMIGKDIEILSRDNVEIDPKFISESKEKDVVILVGGDPLVATTHTDIIMRANAEGVKTRVIHNASIISAIAETGLHIYKFGATVTIPFWTENFRPTSFYDKIVKNMDAGLHTLILLDIDRKNNRYMTANEAIRRLIELDKGRIKNIFVIARLGAPDQKIIFGPMEKLVDMDFGGPLHSLVVPSELHISEKEYIERVIGNL